MLVTEIIKIKETNELKKETSELNNEKKRATQKQKM